jgi:threonine/homoserine/homoserine lactone efflux protein
VNTPVLTVIGIILSVIFKAHLTIAAVGLAVTVSLPWLFLVALALASAVLFWLALRSARGFRSSPYPRPVA